MKSDKNDNQNQIETIRSKVMRVPWGDRFPDVIIDRALGEARENIFYADAKAGNPDAAYHFVKDMITDKKIAELSVLTDCDTVILPTIAIEESGDNMIPLMTAYHLAKRLNLSLEKDIYQAALIGRTRKDGWFRLANTPPFAGTIKQGAKVVLVDDAITQGGTFAGMKGYIENQGATVVAVYALMGKSYSAKLKIDNETLKELRTKYPSFEHWWQDRYGYDFTCLTESEARYILRAKGETVDTIRSKVIEAECG